LVFTYYVRLKRLLSLYSSTPSNCSTNRTTAHRCYAHPPIPVFDRYWAIWSFLLLVTFKKVEAAPVYSQISYHKNNETEYTVVLMVLQMLYSNLWRLPCQTQFHRRTKYNECGHAYRMVSGFQRSLRWLIQSKKICNRCKATRRTCKCVITLSGRMMNASTSAAWLWNTNWASSVPLRNLNRTVSQIWSLYWSANLLKIMIMMLRASLGQNLSEIRWSQFLTRMWSHTSNIWGKNSIYGAKTLWCKDEYIGETGCSMMNR
jgi:hypothetical protein